ncbi:hypothetical protein ACFQO7_00245 [Catellatospora aurea]|uniref:DUF222 domain-containing protein n=1 Tax=Catellatospora aurea TaxID=1337874 RepID=A0ABW2GPW6_9ACTN
MTPSRSTAEEPHRPGTAPSAGRPGSGPRCHHHGTLGLDLHRRVLAATGGDPEQIVGALSDLRELRAAIDHAERDLLTAARRRGVSWARVASALGLRSRQAAEQRATRLGEQAAAAHECQHCVDIAPVAELRSAARDAAAEMAADPSWDGVQPRAALTRAGLAAAAEAPAGALYSLVEHAVSDLAAVDLDGRPVLLRVAVARLRQAYRDAAPGAAGGARVR